MKVFLPILLLVFSVGVGADQWMCVPDMATGFKYKDGRWRSVDFTVEGKRYLLRQLKDDDAYYELFKTMKWVFIKFGNPMPTILCEDDFGYWHLKEELVCHHKDQGFSFNWETLRFTLAKWSDYHNVGTTAHESWELPKNDYEAGTPIISIGSCVKL